MKISGSGVLALRFRETVVRSAVWDVQFVKLSHRWHFHVRKPQLPCSEASATLATFQCGSCPCRTLGASMFGSFSYFGHFPASCATLSQLSRPPDVPGLGWAGLAWVELVGPAWVGLDWGPARFAMARATLSSGPPQGSGRLEQHQADLTKLRGNSTRRL